MIPWVSTTVAKPKAGDRVLLYTRHGDIALGCYGQFEDVWDGVYEWAAENWGYDGAIGKLDGVTHWAPLNIPGE